MIRWIAATFAVLLLTTSAAAQASATAEAKAVEREPAAIRELQKLAGTMPAALPKWESLDVRDTSTGRTVKVYQRPKVAEGLDAVKDRYLEAVEGIPALEEYVEHVFTLPAGGSGFGGGFFVPKDVVDAKWSSLHALTAKLARLGELTVSLGIETEPVQQGDFRMVSIGKTQKHESATNGLLDRVWRGKYSYSVTKIGFKDILGSIDLVLNSSGVLKCTLVPKDAPDNALPCNYEAAR